MSGQFCTLAMFSNLFRSQKVKRPNAWRRRSLSPTCWRSQTFATRLILAHCTLSKAALHVIFSVIRRSRSDVGDWVSISTDFTDVHLNWLTYFTWFPCFVWFTRFTLFTWLTWFTSFTSYTCYTLFTLFTSFTWFTCFACFIWCILWYIKVILWYNFVYEFILVMIFLVIK